MIDPRVEDAIDLVRDTYGVTVKSKNKVLFKYGADTLSSATPAMLWNHTSAEETLPTTNSITTVSSSAAGDSGKTTVVEGHTIDTDGNLSFLTQVVTLLGTAEVPLGTPLARISRQYNSGSTVLVGDIYTYEADTVIAGVPQTEAKIHLKISAGKQQSQKAATSFSSYDYFAMSGIYGTVLEKTGSIITSFEYQIRSSGGVFLPVGDLAASNSSGTVAVNIDPFVIVPANSDVRIMATSSSASKSISGGFFGRILTLESRDLV